MNKKINVFKNVLEKYETEEIKLFVEDMIEKTPDYIFKIPSSTSLKYHNATQCQPGGQLYHILMVCEIMNYLLDLDFIREKFPEAKRRDCMRAAVLLHDNAKCGFDGGQYTVYDHPTIAQLWICNEPVEHNINPKLREYIGRLVASHSGQWTENKRSAVILPKPETWEQFLVHMCDYLGSRSNLDMTYTEDVVNAISMFQTPPTINDYKISFGKYSGKVIADIPKDYCKWLLENMNNLKEPTKTLLKQRVEE